MSRAPATAFIAALAAFASGATAAIVPFTEDFTRGAADWRDAAGNPLTWVAAGGRDGGSFVETSYLVPDPPPPFGAILFRAQDEFGSSGGAFEGDWIADGVDGFSFFLWHDAPLPLNVFARFAGPANSPGAAGIAFAPVVPATWTKVFIPIFDGSPNLILEGASFQDVFSDIGHVQIGIAPGGGLIGQNITVRLDKVSIVPGPGAIAVLAGLLAVRVRARAGRARMARPAAAHAAAPALRH